MTERLYFNDSHLTQFTAMVSGEETINNHPGVILDRTAFYPTGGGQPFDIGRLNNINVIDVVETDDGRIVHLLADGVINAGTAVTGVIDWKRRLDHMQQHTGQHILSQAFVKACGAETRSFHMGDESSTIDIELDKPTAEIMSAAEEIANQVIFENYPVNVHLVDANDLDRFPLRKETGREGEVRIIEVSGFDWSPCGGTHVHATGEIGLIVVKGWERAKKMCRVEFLCGGRVLQDYRKSNAAALGVAQQLSSARDVIPELVRNLIEENKQQGRRIRDLVQIAAGVEAATLYQEGEDKGSFRLVCKVFPGRDAEELKLLAQKITQQGPAVALLASTTDTTRLVFARSDSLPQNMGKLLGEACSALGGRGGGRPELAQGGAPASEKLPEVLENAGRSL
ncbi:MAG TPA: DHHA1 domain-containing protein [Blastocatellia bacterium]|nr:DHHA1 domain-containing protein [Blastocatellia bacterium]